MCARHILANWSKNWKGIERRNVFWKCARSTFEAELKANLESLRQLGSVRSERPKIVEDLLRYNKERWCKVYFEEFSKCDVVDNNMAESFNAWVLQARHKTIITMLEEIRVKMMERIGQLRDFSNTWKTHISPMALKNLLENIVKSMKCTLKWNGDTGFEVVEGDYQHTVNLGNMTCSCRSWQLRGIPCPHAIAAMHHKRVEPIDYVASCYNKETYLNTYANFIQPLTNMKMWPLSNNPSVEPPIERRMPGRPRKVRRREAGESSKKGKLSKNGIVMTCSICRLKGHNKRSCSAKPPEVSRPSIAGTTVASASIPATQKEASRGKGRGRGRERKGTGTGPASAHYKRPRMVGVGVMVASNGCSILNPGLPSRRVINTGARTLKRSDEVTGDIGFQPSGGLKWKGKTSISSNRLEHIRGEKLMHARSSSAAANNSSQDSSTGNSQVPWK